jgi:hypothetical protein
MRTGSAALLLTAAPSISAEAQEIAGAVSSYAAFGIDDRDGELPLSAELRLTVALSDRFAIEPFITAGWHQGRPSVGPEGFYGAQIRHRIVRLTGKDAFAFVTYGAAAYYSRFGSSQPVSGHFGFGLRRRMSERLAFRSEVQLVTFHIVPIGARFIAGFPIDLGDGSPLLNWNHRAPITAARSRLLLFW